MFSSASLATQFPAAAAAKDVASGLLTFALPGQPLRRLLWFRPEIIRTVTWGGDPAKPVARDDSMRLQPRASFAAWKEEVRLQSHPWTDGDLAAAEDLRRYALEIDLERQVLRASRAVFARDEILAIVSHDLRNPLGVVQMDAADLKTWEVPRRHGHFQPAGNRRSDPEIGRSHEPAHRGSIGYGEDRRRPSRLAEAPRTEPRSRRGRVEDPGTAGERQADHHREGSDRGTAGECRSRSYLLCALEHHRQRDQVYA